MNPIKGGNNMISMLQNWKGSFEVNGTTYDSFEALNSANLNLGNEIHIKLYPKGYTTEIAENKPVKQVDIQSPELVITVKPYMTKKSCPEFDFMSKWNNDIPMPLRTMVGTKVKETPGMVYMKLHGDILAKVTETCMCCGKPITNPISRYFGMGPICGNHNYVNPFDTEQELQEAVKTYRDRLQSITWEGWIIKSAIIEQKERG